MFRKLIIICFAIMLLAACTPNEKPANMKEGNKIRSGLSQSPINITTANLLKMKDPGSLIVNYPIQQIIVRDNGYTLQASARGKLHVNGRSFLLSQFHFHAQSEHTINGKHLPMEAHFVHKAQNGRIAVVAVMLKEGEKNTSFQAILENVARNEGAKVRDFFEIEKILPQNKSYYHYLGSLTTSPFTENVEWYIMQNAVKISKSQIDDFSHYYKDNNRNIQDLNGRPLLKYNQLNP